MFVASTAGDVVRYALAGFLVAVGLALGFALLWLAGVLRRVSSFLKQRACRRAHGRLNPCCRFARFATAWPWSESRAPPYIPEDSEPWSGGSGWPVR